LTERPVVDNFAAIRFVTRLPPAFDREPQHRAPVTTRLILTLCAIGVLAIACGRPSNTPEATAAAPAKAVANNSALVTIVDVDVSNDVRFAFHVRNNSKKKIELLFPNGQTHDLAVFDATGREVWRWSNGRMFTQALQTKLLGNGETLSYEERWENPAPGTYTVVGRLNSESHPVEQRTEFTIAK
jgi:hypothetical protein